jgi:hypothetical protein
VAGSMVLFAACVRRRLHALNGVCFFAGAWMVVLLISYPTYSAHTAFLLGLVITGCAAFGVMGVLLVDLNKDVRVLLEAAGASANEAPGPPPIYVNSDESQLEKGVAQLRATFDAAAKRAQDLTAELKEEIRGIKEYVGQCEKKHSEDILRILTDVATMNEEAGMSRTRDLDY